MTEFKDLIQFFFLDVFLYFKFYLSGKIFYSLTSERRQLGWFEHLARMLAGPGRAVGVLSNWEDALGQTQNMQEGEKGSVKRKILFFCGFTYT